MTRSADGHFELRASEERSDQDYDYRWELVHVRTCVVVESWTGHWYFNGVGVTSAGGFERVSFANEASVIETGRYTGRGQGDSEPGERRRFFSVDPPARGSRVEEVLHALVARLPYPDSTNGELRTEVEIVTDVPPCVIAIVAWSYDYSWNVEVGGVGGATCKARVFLRRESNALEAFAYEDLTR